MTVRILVGDCISRLSEISDRSIHCCVTSPPYWGLRDYGQDGQIGLEDTPEAFVARMVEVFREVRRVLREDGTLWLNLGDSYASGGRTYRAHDAKDSKGGRVTGDYRPSDPDGIKPKDLVGIPWRVAFALQADGWYLRQDIIWHKPNPMPESVRDRCTKAHEYVFLLSKSARYWYDAEAVREESKPESVARYGYAFGGEKSETLTREEAHGVGTRTHPIGRREPTVGRNLRSVWTITTKPYSGAHFATFPPELPERCIKAGCPEGGTVLDPFFGAGTTGLVADRLKRSCIGIELNPEYAEIARKRIRDDNPMFASVEVL